MKNGLVALLCLLLCTLAHAKIPSVSAGKIEQIAEFESKLIPSRTVNVWLPPGYDANQSYPVIYMHDGQMLFDETQTWNGQEWEVDEVASRLIAAQSVTPFIVVGMANGDANRHSEYFPQKPFESLSKEKQTALYATERGADTPLFANKVYSDLYLRFIVEEVIPHIESNYSASPKREDRYLLGSSMGGLISMYGLLEHPDVFYGAACLSTHWPGAFESENNPIPEAFLSYMKANLPTPGKHKLYFDFGTETLDAMYPELQANVDLLMREKGFDEPYWQTLKFEGAAHKEADWAKRLHLPIQFLLTK